MWIYCKPNDVQSTKRKNVFQESQLILEVPRSILAEPRLDTVIISRSSSSNHNFRLAIYMHVLLKYFLFVYMNDQWIPNPLNNTYSSWIACIVLMNVYIHVLHRTLLQLVTGITKTWERVKEIAHWYNRLYIACLN